MGSLKLRKLKLWRCFWLMTLLALVGVIPSTPPPGVILPPAASSPLGPTRSQQQVPEEEEVKHKPSIACSISLSKRLQLLQRLLVGYVPRRVDTNPQPGLRLDHDYVVTPTRESELPPTGLRAPPAFA